MTGSSVRPREKVARSSKARSSLALDLVLLSASVRCLSARRFILSSANVSLEPARLLRRSVAEGGGSRPTAQSRTARGAPGAPVSARPARQNAAAHVCECAGRRRACM